MELYAAQHRTAQVHAGFREEDPLIAGVPVDLCVPEAKPIAEIAIDVEGCGPEGAAHLNDGVEVPLSFPDRNQAVFIDEFAGWRLETQLQRADGRQVQQVDLEESAEVSETGRPSGFSKAGEERRILVLLPEEG